MKLKSTVATIALLASLSVWSAAVTAASLSLHVTDAAGWPSSDAVVYLEAANGQTLPKQLRSVQIEQSARKFVPAVTVIQTGTMISFPNHDSVRHHVYSFSTPKIFELKLYSGAGGDPILFDKPGTVVVGCNIHDQMAAFIHIVDTPYFGKTDASGKLVLDNIHPGKYQVKVWHSTIPASMAIPAQAITIGNVDLALPILLTFKTEKK
jgi:plastocyanin